jgi:SAM-dependent methyltransferase
MDLIIEKAFDINLASGDPFEVVRFDLGRTSSLHWSRVFEYPWAIMNGELKSNDVVLAAGGNGILQFYLSANCKQIASINPGIDSISHALKTLFLGKPLSYYFPNIYLEEVDIPDILINDKTGKGFSENFFDKIFCISVLEHIQDVEGCFAKLMKVVKPGGFLMGTVDVASTIRHNHTVDLDRITRILSQYGIKIPMCEGCGRKPLNVLSHTFDEDNPLPTEPKTVELNVLCFKIYK